MEITTSKEVKKFILDPSHDLEELFDGLDEEYMVVVEGIFNALFILVKNYSQNKSRADYLVCILEELVELKCSSDLKKMIGPIIDFQNKINGLSLKNKILVKEISIRVQNIFNEIQMKGIHDTQNEKMRCLEFLIFYDKNYFMLENFLNDHDNILSCRNQDGENILVVVLKRYLFSVDEVEIDYLYHVILIFLNSKYGKNILRGKEQYLRIIRMSKLGYMEHVIRLIELFDPEFVITRSELEERYGIHFDFPCAIMNEINSFHMKTMDRVDFTNQLCITIDGDDAKCLDDALSVLKCEDGCYMLYIHITDVSSFIPFSSMLREEAYYRGETIYLRDNNILLYPDRISENICSLLANNYRNTISYCFKLDSHYRVIPDSFYLTLGKIKVTHRLTYDEVDARIKQPMGEELDNVLDVLVKFAYERRSANEKKQIYRDYENLVHSDIIHESLKVNSSFSANIVHESMILVNYQVAKYFKSMGFPYIYRNFNIPSSDFLEEQVRKIKSMGSNMGDNKEFLGKLKDSYVESVYCRAPIYHRGLKLDCYSHSTSPLRRYMDSLGQYIIHDLLFGGNVGDDNIYKWEYRIDRAVQCINDKKKLNEMFLREYNYLSYKKLIKEKK